MAQTIETLDDGTHITDEVADKLVADVYTTLDRGAYRVIPNPHGKPQPRKLSDPLLRAKIEEALASSEG
jgi:hypothetical protein